MLHIWTATNTYVHTDSNIYPFSTHAKIYNNSIIFLFLESVLQNNQGTEVDVAQVVSSLLKYASDTKGGSGRKEQWIYNK